MKRLIPFIFIATFVSALLFSQEKTTSTEQPELQFNILANFISTQSFSIEDIERLNIKTTYESISFSEVYGEEISVDLHGNNNTLLPKIELKDKTLSVISTAEKYTPGDICRIIIYLPRDIPLKDFVLIQNNITKGKLNIPNIKSDNMQIETINYDISGDKLHSNLLIKSYSGDINITKTNSSQIYAITEKGNININYFTGNYIYLKGNNNIIADNISCDFFNIKNTSGTTQLVINKAPKNMSSIKSQEGFIQIFVPTTEDFNISAISKKGMLYDKIINKRVSTRKEYNKVFNKGGSQVYIESSTGNIEIDKL